MPVKECGNGWQYGNSGKCYTGKEAKKKAHIQGYAIQKSQERRGKKVHKDDVQKAAINILSEVFSEATFHNIHGLQESYNDGWYGAMKHPKYGCFKIVLAGKDSHTAAKFAAVTEKVYPDEALPTMALMDKLNNALKITEDIDQCPDCKYKNPTPEALDGMSEAKREIAIKIKMNEEGEYLCYNEDAHDKVPHKFDAEDVNIVAEMAVTTGSIAIHPGYQSSTGPRKETKPEDAEYGTEEYETESPMKSMDNGKKNSTSRGPKGIKTPGRRKIDDDIDRIAGSMSDLI